MDDIQQRFHERSIHMKGLGLGNDLTGCWTFPNGELL